jgi:hypothetical protein
MFVRVRVQLQTIPFMFFRVLCFCSVPSCAQEYRTCVKKFCNIPERTSNETDQLVHIKTEQVQWPKHELLGRFLD